MERSRSRFTRWFLPARPSPKNLSRTKSVVPKRSEINSEIKESESMRVKTQSLTRIDMNCINEVKEEKPEIYNPDRIYSTLQPEIYACLDSESSDMDIQSSSSGVSSQQDLEYIRKELIIRTNGVTLAFEILETIFSTCVKYFKSNTLKMNIIERIFKDIKCMSNFHHLYQEELNKVIHQDLPLSLIFNNQIINSALNWYKIFYITFEPRSKLMNSLYTQDSHFKTIADKAIIVHTQDTSDHNFRNLPWILNSMKDSLFHFEVLLARYSDCLEDPREKCRINDAIKLIQNILRSCNMHCDYNDFINTQQEYSLLSFTEPLSPSVRFIHKGIVKKLCHNGTRVRSRIIVLFTHMVFITKKNAQFNSIKIKNQFSLSTCNFYILPSDKCLANKKGFRLESGDFFCEFLLERDEQFYVWIDKLNSTICQARLRKRSFDRKINTYVNVETSDDHTHIDLGFEIPIWQQRKNSNFCNGFKCPKRLASEQPQNNCASDGLLYCLECLSFSAHLSYCNSTLSVCKECHEILTQPDSRLKAIERQNTKTLRIQRFGIIKGWLTISKISYLYIDSVETSEKLFCVLNPDCTLYIYESPEDKYHQLPLRLLRATFSISNSLDNSFVNNCVKIKQTEFNYILEAESQEETLRWIQTIKLTQLENLNKV